MNNKTNLIVVFLIISIALLIYFSNLPSLSTKPAIQSISENGIYVGGRESELELPPDEADGFSKTVEGLSAGWENIRIGNSYDTAGQFEQAMQAYKKAYEIDPGNRLFSGDKLIEAYEKLSQYDEAIALVDEILKTQPLVEYGVAKFTAIRTRLLAAKAVQEKHPASY